VSKRDRDRREQARQIIAAQKRAQARQRRLLIAGGAVVVVLAVFAVLVLVRLGGGAKKNESAEPELSGAAALAITSQLAAVPADLLDKVGTGGISELPSAVTGQTKLTDGGHPLVLYVGAEYCPYCAAQRWPMVVALSRFGTFSGLSVTHSASDDSFPNTPTLSFHGATYKSDYLTFQGVETTTNEKKNGDYAPLQQLTSAQQQLVQKYNAPPYIPQDAAGSIPFIDYANQAVSAGSYYSPQLLAGKTAAQVAAAINDPTTDIGKKVAGSANAITAVLCKLTGGQPGNVCTSAAVKAYAGKFDAVAAN
jgi:hypothetical protein